MISYFENDIRNQGGRIWLKLFVTMCCILLCDACIIKILKLITLCIVLENNFFVQINLNLQHKYT